MILEILKEVAYQRFYNSASKKNEIIIRLSKIFMDQAVKELRETTGYTFISSDTTTEFLVTGINNIRFTVQHRPYKDDSNDDDFEQIIIGKLYQLKPNQNQ